MAVEGPDDLRLSCEAYLGEQRRLLAVLYHGGDPRRVCVAMQAELDQFAAALRRSESSAGPVPRSEPGS